MTDVSPTLVAKSDQMNAQDLAEPVTVTIEKVTVTDPKGDQPVHVHLKEPEWAGKPWKPCKTARRILARLWGTDAAKWIGRQVTLYNDPTVKWAGEAVGGIRVSHMSDIPGVQEISTMYSRGKFAKVRIEPIAKPKKPAEPPATPDEYAAFLAQLAPFGWEPDAILATCQERWKVDPRALPLDRLMKLAKTLAKEKEGE
jgi:hypothetical protein